MSAQHTPGPWAVDADHTSVVAGSRLIAQCAGAIAPANARLIAAAPAMLEALQEVVEWWYRTGGGMKEIPAFIDSAAKALALAEGRS